MKEWHNPKLPLEVITMIEFKNVATVRPKILAHFLVHVYPTTCHCCQM